MRCLSVCSLPRNLLSGHPWSVAESGGLSRTERRSKPTLATVRGCQLRQHLTWENTVSFELSQARHHGGWTGHSLTAPWMWKSSHARACIGWGKWSLPCFPGNRQSGYRPLTKGAWNLWTPRSRTDRRRCASDAHCPLDVLAGTTRDETSCRRQSHRVKVSKCRGRKFQDRQERRCAGFAQGRAYPAEKFLQ